MRNIAWYLVGWLFAERACQLLPSDDGLSPILSSFILEPLSFLEGAIFILASFLFFSYSIRYSIFSLINLSNEKRRLAGIYGMIGTIIVISTWIYLLYQSIYISLVIIFLSVIHLFLSMESFKKVTHKER